jgi:dTDP-4-dehydrorhamnose reductase
MRILITGAGGMLGQDVSTAADAAGHEAFPYPRTELDICDPPALRSVMERRRPDAVINCAAWTNVDSAEEEYGAALALNGSAAGNVAAAADSVGAWTLHVSTDYVFDGTKRSPYVESDPVGPVSGYGRSKLAGEEAVAEAAPERHTVVRTAWLFGAGGNCFPKTILRLAGERDELSVVDDQVGCPTYTAHLAGGLIELASARLVGVVHMAASGQCSWFEFAREIVERRGVECHLTPCTTDEFPRPAPRPAYSVLRSEREAPLLPDWSQGLDEFLAAVVPV